VGWALTPAICVGIVALLKGQIEHLAAAWQRRRVRAFNGKELGPALEALVQEALTEATADPKVCLALG
jgi:hypothetical protein